MLFSTLNFRKNPLFILELYAEMCLDCDNMEMKQLDTGIFIKFVFLCCGAVFL